MTSLNKKVVYFTLLLFLNYILIPSYLLIKNTAIRTISFFTLFLLIVLSTFFLKKLLTSVQYQQSQETTDFNLKFILLAVFVILSQLFLLFQPITFTDEIAYISKGMYPYVILNNLSNSVFHIPIIILSYLFLLILVILFLIFRKINFSEYYNKKHFLLTSIIILSLLSIIIFLITNTFFESFLSKIFTSKSLEDKLSWLTNSVQIIYYLFPYLFFGLNEFSSRILSLISYIASGYFLIKILKLLNIRRYLYPTLLLFFFLPAIFYYGNLTFATTEIILFVISVSYFFLKFEASKDQNSLFYFILLFTLMLFYDKKTNALFLGLFIFFILKFLLINKFNIKQFLEQNKTILLSLIFIILVTIPQNLIKSFSFYQTSLNELNPYLTNTSSFLNLNNWLSLFQSTRVLLNLPSQLSWVFLILLIPLLLIILHQAFIKKNTNLLYFISIFLGYYIFFTSLIYNGSPRYTIPILFIFPVFYIYSIKFLSLNKPDLKKYFSFVTSLLTLFMVLFTLFLAYHNYQDRYLPIDKAFSYIKQELPNEKFLKTMAPSSYNFYIIKNNLNFNNFDPTIWEKEENQTINNLYGYMNSHNITYIILPLPNYSYDSFYPRKYTTWLDLSNYKDLTAYPILNHSLVDNIYNDKSEKFEKIKEFKLGKNIIFIAKIND